MWANLIRWPLGLAAFIVFSATAQQELDPVSYVEPAPKLMLEDRTLSVRQTFEELGSPRQSLKLSGVTSSYSFAIPLSPRERIASAKLHLETVNSTALIQNRSELKVVLNNKILAQYQLSPDRTYAVNDLVLPKELLKAGYNDLTVSVVQHYTHQCENPFSPELWTQIDGKRSAVTLEFEGEYANLSPRLSQLSAAFDRRGWLPRRVAVVMGSEGLTEGNLTAAALAAQGLSLRRDHKPIHFEVYSANEMAAEAGVGRFPGLAPKAYAGKDVLLVGTRAELSRYVSQDLYGLLSGPFVGVFAADHSGALVLVVSGSSTEELLQAARTLADPEFKFSDLPMERVGASSLPVPRILEGGNPSTFEKLGFRTQTLRMGLNGNAILEFRAPGNFAAKRGEFAKLQMHFSYGAGLHSSSSVNLYVNDTFVKSVELDEAGGADVSNALLQIPAQLIRPGMNSMAFEPKMKPLTQEGVCASDWQDRGTLSIFEDSRIEIPHPSLTARAPDLSRTSRSFWPYDNGVTLLLTNRKPDTAAAGLELLALMAQRNRAPLDAKVSFSLPATGHVLGVGPFHGIPDAFEANNPLKRYEWVAEGSNMGVLQVVDKQRVLTGVFAKDAQVLKDGIALMRTHGMWRSLAGTAAIVDTQEKTIRVEGVQEDEQTEVVGQPAAKLDWRLGTAAAALLVSGIALIAALILRRKIQKRVLPGFEDTRQEPRA